MSAVSEEQKKERYKLPLRMYIKYLLIASFLCTGVALSKYMTTGTTSDGARVAKIGDVSVSEQGAFVKSEKVGDDTEYYFYLTPGADVDMDAGVRFTGSEMACYVFVKMTQEGFTTSDGVHFSYDGKFTWSIDSDWTYLKQEEDGTYIYYYVVDAGEALEHKSIIASPGGTVSADVTRTELEAFPYDELEIDFAASVVQGDGFGDYATQAEHALAAWTSLSAH